MKKGSTDTLKFVFFDIVTSPKVLTMALNVQKIKEVVEYGNLSILPDSCEHIVGVYNLRGTPIPIFDILSIISNAQTNGNHTPEKSRIIICDLQNTLIGFTVARTGRTISCPASNFLPPPKGGHIRGKKIISGMVMKDDSYTPVLDLDSILDMVDPDDNDDFGQGEIPLGEYRGKKVLVVEDSRTILKKITQVFSEMGFAVDTAENGSEALQKLDGSNVYDLIFTDIEMPLLDGISMARKIKKLPSYDAVPILFNSALSNPALINDIEQEKLGRYIVKYDKALIVAEVATAFKKTA